MAPKNRKVLSAAEYIEANPRAGQALEFEWIENSEQVLTAYMVNNITLFNHGLGVCEPDIIIKDCILHDCHIDPILARFGNDISASSESICLDGEFVSLVGPWCDGFWHWMLEFLPRLLIAETLGFSGKYIIPPILSGFMVESLSLLDIDSDRIIVFNTNKSLGVSRLLIPQRIYTGTCDYAAGRNYLFLIKLLREKILKNISLSDAGNKRVYISRKNARNGRRIVNASQLAELLGDYGFESYEFEDMHLKEQITIMANANWLIGPHGAGFVHTLFMPRSSNVIEIFSPNYINPCMVDTVKLLKHNYHMIASRNDGEYKFRNDIVAPLELIRVTIENIISNGSGIDNG